MPAKPPEGPPAPPPLSSFQDLYAAEFKFVWHALWRLGIPNRDLPDLTHRVLFIAFLSWVDYDPTRPLKPWLLGITYRIAADYHRLARHARELIVPNEMLDVVDESSDLDDLMMKRDLCASIEKLGQQLPDDRRTIFIQHDIEGIAIPEIARSMNIPINTAYSRLRLARQDIRKRLERQMRRRRPLRGVYFIAGASERIRRALAHAVRWLARGVIAAVAISMAGIFPGAPFEPFPPAPAAVEGAAIPSARPIVPVKRPVRVPSQPEPPAPAAASASISHQGSIRDAILDTRACLTKRLAPSPVQQSPR